MVRLSLWGLLAGSPTPCPACGRAPATTSPPKSRPGKRRSGRSGSRSTPRNATSRARRVARSKESADRETEKFWSHFPGAGKLLRQAEKQKGRCRSRRSRAATCRSETAALRRSTSPSWPRWSGFRTAYACTSASPLRAAAATCYNHLQFYLCNNPTLSSSLWSWFNYTLNFMNDMLDDTNTRRMTVCFRNFCILYSDF